VSISSVGGSSLLQQMQQALFAKADANGDGQLSSDEFSAIGQNLPPPGKGGPARPMKGADSAGGNFSAATMGSLLSMQQDRTDRLTKLFNGADANGDGQVTAEELSANLASGASAGASTTDTAAKAASLIKAGDTNSDGALSLAEFQAMAPAGRGHRPEGGGGDGGGQAAAAAPTSKTYNPADTNKDGQVSMSELLTSLQSTQGSISGFSSQASDLLAKLLTSLGSNSTAATATSTVSQTA
jgi:Ca2+-binding EF-hand superfamily protein